MLSKLGNRNYFYMACACTVFYKSIICSMRPLKFLVSWNLTSNLSWHTCCFPQEALRNAKRVIKIVVGVVGAAVIAAVGVPTAMKIAARPEVAAVLKAVTTWSLAVLKYIGMEVLETLKYIGMDVLEMLKDAAAMAVRSLHPHIVAIIIALVTNQSDWRQQYY